MKKHVRLVGEAKTLCDRFGIGHETIPLQGVIAALLRRYPERGRMDAEAKVDVCAECLEEIAWRAAKHIFRDDEDRNQRFET